MKKCAFCVVLIFLFLVFSVDAQAYSSDWYDEIIEVLTPETKKMLEDFGINKYISEDYSGVTVEKAFDCVIGIFRSELTQPLNAAGLCLGLLLITAVICNFLPEKSGVGSMGKSIAIMCIMFCIISVSGDIFTQCCSSLKLMGDFMLVLIPVFAGIISFSGNPSLAVSFNTVVFSFAQLVIVFFDRIVPCLSGIMICVGSAGAINPIMKLDSVSKMLSKILNLVMAFVAGIFVAVLSVRGVIAGAADTVGIRGVRFLIGNTVPVVGSALGEALNSVVAGFGLIKHTAGMIGIIAVIITGLPVLIKVVIWKGVLYFLSVASEIIGVNEIKSFSDSLSQILAVIIGAICFSVFVFVISIALILTVGGHS